MASTIPEAEARYLASALSTARFSDMTLTCGGHIFNVHRMQLSLKSGFFKAAIGGPFSESQAANVNLPEDDPSLIARMLTFLYTNTYSTQLCPTIAGLKLDVFNNIDDAFACRDDSDSDEEVLHAYMFALADKYDIPTLRKESLVRFCETWHGEGAIEEGDSAEESDDWFKDVDTERVIDTVYRSVESRSPECRNIVLQTILWRIQDHDLLQSKSFRAYVAESIDLALDLALCKLSEFEAECTNCSWKGEMVIRECECGQFGFCETQKCRQKWSEQFICTQCFSLGTLRYPDGDGS